MRINRTPAATSDRALDGESFEPRTSGGYRYVPFGRHTFGVHAVGPDGTRGVAAIVEYESLDLSRD